MVSTPLKNISQIGNLPQIGVNIKKNIWNHHLDDIFWKPLSFPAYEKKYSGFHHLPLGFHTTPRPDREWRIPWDERVYLPTSNLVDCFMVKSCRYVIIYQATMDLMGYVMCEFFDIFQCPSLSTSREKIPPEVNGVCGVCYLRVPKMSNLSFGCALDV